MKVLFVRSGNNGTDPISTRQGESLRKAGVDIYYYDITGKGISGYLKNLRPLRRYIKEAKIEIVHAHYSMSGFIASLSCSGKTVVTSLMGSDVLGTNHLLLFTVRFFSRFIWDITIVKTPEMQKKLGIRNTLVIPNGIDMEMFVPRDKQQSQLLLGWSPDEKHILFCSDPQRQEKNFKLAGQAIAKAGEMYHSHALKVHFLSGIHSDEVAGYYSAADLLLVTSKHEGSSNTVKEAMACNCPVVSTDVGDTGLVIKGTSGCFITEADPQGIADAIIKVVSSGKRTDGRNRVAYLSSDKTALQIADLYRGLLKKNHIDSNC